MHLMYAVRAPPWVRIADEPTSRRTFMTLKNPSILFRAMILGAQGIFYNAFCKRTASLHGVPRKKLTSQSSLVLFALSEDMPSVRGSSRRGGCHHVVSSGVHIGSI